MKTLLIIALLSFGFCTAIKAQEYTAPNVLSYYAMGNSIDGQPMVEMANVLRFYPVFALRDFTDTVIVTVYYGPYVYTDIARPMDNKHYWEARLPRFELGEAIQRIDVRTTIDISKHPIRQRILAVYDSIKIKLDSFLDAAKKNLDPNKANKLIENLEKSIGTLMISLNTLNNTIKSKNDIIKIDQNCDTASLNDIIKKLSDTTSFTDTTRLNDLISKIETYLSEKRSKINNIDNWHNELNTSQQKVNQTIQDDLETNRKSIQAAIKKGYDTLFEFNKIITSQIITTSNSLRDDIANESYEQITDTNYSGPSVRKGDVIIGENKDRIHILYRNHKTSLRQLPALDPVESMGLFRIRYIPFVIAGENLMTTFTGDNSAVFEVGLAFGDVRVSGDDFVKPELSIRRLGVAFAITNRLFGEDARIRALALTYDFNSYGSIAAGVNFPGKDVEVGTINESYISFGINKRAFEQLLKGLTGLF